MNANIIVKNAEDFQTSAWAGGTTTQLYIYPETADYKKGDFQARISSATVEIAKSEFTSLPGVKRYLMIFEGHLVMIHGVNVRVELEPYEVDMFDGGMPTVSYGKVTDFNLMLKNGADGKMESAVIETGDTLVLESGDSFDLLAVFVGEGSIETEGKCISEKQLLICTDWREPLTVANVQERPAKIGICKIRTV